MNRSAGGEEEGSHSKPTSPILRILFSLGPTYVHSSQAVSENHILQHFLFSVSVISFKL